MPVLFCRESRITVDIYIYHISHESRVIIYTYLHPIFYFFPGRILVLAHHLVHHLMAGKGRFAPTAVHGSESVDG